MRLRGIVGVALAATAIAGAPACHSVEAAAKRDPMQCERDPKCEQKRSRVNDCATQCNDDPMCMDRCEQIQQGNKLGH